MSDVQPPNLPLPGGDGPRVSVVIPAYDEAEQIVPCLTRILEAVTLPCEVVVVVDFPEDTTVPVVEKWAVNESRLRVAVSTYGRGPANAIRYGIEHALAPVAVVTMADGSDDPRQIDDLTRLVERGVVIAAASRYMAGGQQVGGPLLKTALSRTAGRSLQALTRVGTRDATNSFKAYSTDFVRQVGIDSRAGFEIGLELTAKARRLGQPVAEIPTIWLERQAGVSNFKLAAWIPQYLRWYRFAFGPRVDLDRLRHLTGTAAPPAPPPAPPSSSPPGSPPAAVPLASSPAAATTGDTPPVGTATAGSPYDPTPTRPAPAAPAPQAPPGSEH